MVHMAPQILTTYSLGYILPPNKWRSVDVGSIASLWAVYSSNAKELGHEDLPEEDRVRVSKILSILSSTVNSLESSIKPLIEKQAEGEARKILDIVAGKVKELAGKDVEIMLSGPWLSLHYSIAENTLSILIRQTMSAYVDSEELAEQLSGRMPKALEEIKATAKSHVDKLLEDASKTAWGILQGMRRCGIAPKARVSLTLSLYIDGHSYEYRLGETTL
jgi:hypothetical protein